MMALYRAPCSQNLPKFIENIESVMHGAVVCDAMLRKKENYACLHIPSYATIARIASPRENRGVEM
jgi:hypothetical protein